MRGMHLAEAAHIVNIIPPIDISGGKTGDIFSMENFEHATIIVQIGVSAAAFTAILVNACSDFSATGATAIPFKYFMETTAAGDTLTDVQAALAAGVEPTANNDVFYVIELDAASLPEDKHFVQLSLTNGVNSVIASAVAVLSGPRYTGPETAIA